jgi:hypothetical protein
MRLAWLIVLLLAAAPALGQVYRWTDARGTVHYSNAPPPPGTKANVIDIPAKEGPASPDTTECYTVRCQGERMEERLRRRDELEAKLAAERAANAPPPVRGLEFRKYISVQRGMTEGELLVIAGPPDFIADQGIAIAAPATVQSARHARAPARSGLSLKTWTYLPTPADPFVTTITLVGGRVSEIERAKKF